MDTNTPFYKSYHILHVGEYKVTHYGILGHSLVHNSLMYFTDSLTELETAFKK